VGVLGGMGMGAYFQVMGGQKSAGTKTIITTVASEYQQQRRAAIDDARDYIARNGIPSGIQQMAGDPDRATVIFMKTWLRREFPESYDEALNAPFFGLGPNESYRRMLTSPQINWSASKEQQSSACLLMALRTGRRGMKS